MCRYLLVSAKARAVAGGNCETMVVQRVQALTVVKSVVDNINFDSTDGKLTGDNRVCTNMSKNPGPVDFMWTEIGPESVMGRSCWSVIQCS